MTEERNRGNQEPEGSEAAAAAAGTPDPAVTETPSGADAIAAENERLKKELEEQKQLNLAWKPKVEKFNQLERQGALPGAASPSPMPPQGVDPEIEELQRLVAEYNETQLETTRALIRDKYQRIQARREQEMFNNWIAERVAGVDASSEDEETKELARELIRSARVANAEEALFAARGRRGDKKALAEAERQKRDEIARARASASPATAVGGDVPPASAAKKKMTQRDYTDFLTRNAGSPAASQLISDVDNGRVVLDTSVV